MRVLCDDLDLCSLNFLWEVGFFIIVRFFVIIVAVFLLGFLFVYDCKCLWCNYNSRYFYFG